MSKSARRKQMQEQKRERERQREHDLEQRRLQAAFNADQNQGRNFIEELIDSQEIAKGDTSDLQDVTLTKLQSMLSRDWVLANNTKAQEHDIRYKLEVMQLKALKMHPPEESVITGPVRAFLYGDEMEELRPLSAQERIIIDETFETLKARATRGREGFERKQMNTNIAETRTESESNDNRQGGMLKGLF